VDPDRFDRSLERAKHQIALHRGGDSVDKAHTFLKRLVVQRNGREIFLPIERIDWAESDANYLVLHAGREAFTVRVTLEHFVRQLDPDQFVRINRSQLVNLDRVKEMQPWFHGERRIVLDDGRELTWTRRFRSGFRAVPSRR
jgi:two-component system LytT family response regulator